MHIESVEFSYLEHGEPSAGVDINFELSGQSALSHCFELRRKIRQAGVAFEVSGEGRVGE